MLLFQWSELESRVLVTLEEFYFNREVESVWLMASAKFGED